MKLSAKEIHRRNYFLTVYLSSIVGSASIGVYSLATENIVMIPRMVPLQKAQEFADWLKVKLILHIHQWFSIDWCIGMRKLKRHVGFKRY